MVADAPRQNDALSDIRSAIADRGLISLAILAVPGLAASLSRIPLLGWSPVMTVHLILAVVVITAALKRARMSYRLRAGILVGTFFTLGLAGSLIVGVLLGPQLFFLGACALAFLLFGQTAGIVSLLASLASIALAYIRLSGGTMHTGIDLNVYFSSPSAWVVNSVSIVIISVVIGASTDFILRGFVRSLDLSRQQNIRLEQQMTQLLQLQAALDIANQAVCISDVTVPGAPAIFVNGAFERTTGYLASEVLGKSLRFLHRDDRDQAGLAAIRAAVETGHACSTVIRNYRKDGSMFWSDVRIAPARNEKGEISSYVCLISDVTQRRMAEESSREQQKLEAIGTLAGGLAHDFNNLLGVIIGNLDLSMESYPGDPRLKDALAAAMRAADVTQALLGVAQRQALNVETLDLSSIVNRMLPLIKASVGGAVNVRTSLAPDALMARIDSGGITSVILNLVINACDAMRDAGRERVLTLSTRSVRLEAGNARSLPPGNYALLQVTDTGTGMSESVKSTAFDPFFTTKPRHAAKGLGLATVYGYAEQLNGRAVLESTPGSGTTVSLYLPLDGPELPAGDGAGATGSLPAPIPGRQKVLVVDDEDGLREIACSWLNSLGYETVAANSPAAALEQLSRARFDFIFTDVVMPGGMNGVELAREAIRAQPGLRAIITSGYSESTRGSTDLPGPFLRKPYRKKDLQAVFAKADKA